MNNRIKLFTTILLTIFGSILIVNAQNQINLLDNLTYPGKTLNDIWGYSSGANEYALVGLTDGFSVVNVTNPNNAVQVQTQNGINSLWRDIKTWGNYAYVSNESGNGIEIFDLSGLPSSMTNSFWTGNNGVSFSTAHNLYIDEFGIMYVFGADYQTGGAIMADLAANPTNPPVVGVYNTRYCHDGFARNNILYTAEINNGIFSIVDVTNKSNTVVLATQATTNNFTHNTWLSDDGSHLFTTDERPGSEVGSYDISNLGNIQRVDGNFSSPSTGTVPHNTHVLDDCLITSWYTDGVTVVDAKVPSILVEVGFYDTNPSTGGSFDGCWGAFPFLPSGNILASDQTEGLFVLEAGCPCAVRLTGTITDAASGNSINNATVTFTGQTNANTTSDITGYYGTGTPNAGTYSVTFDAPGYASQTITVNMTNCATVSQNVQLALQGACSQSGQITDGSGSPLSGVTLVFDDGAGFTATATTNASGNYTANLTTNTTFNGYVGKWGYITQAITNVQACGNLDITLQQGYCDDFAADLGWSASNNGATTGFWELGEPIGTDLNGTPANPDFDVNNDLGDQCYVTGNAGGGVGGDDIDGGEVILTSPAFDLSAGVDPYIEYDRWYFDDGGNSAADDEMVVEISNNGGSSYTTVETITDGNQESQWVNNNFRVLNFVTLSSNMRLRFRASDIGQGHIVEAGVDDFCISDQAVAQPAAAFTSSQNSGCSPFTVTYTDNSTNNPTSWNWSFPGGSPATSTAQNPTITYNTPGTYNVTLTATNAGGSGSTTTNSAITVNANPTVSFTLPASTGASSPINLSASPSGGTFSGPGVVFSAFNPSIAGPGQHDITYTYTDANGCTATATDNIFVFAITYNFVVYNLGTIAPKILGNIDESMQVYPNPVVDYIELSFFTSELPGEDLQYTIYDVSGKLQQSNTMNIRDMYHTEKIDFSNLIAGTYILNISNSAGTVSKRIIKR